MEREFLCPSTVYSSELSACHEERAAQGRRGGGAVGEARRRVEAREAGPGRGARGLAVAGFGFGATIWVKLAGSWFGGLLNTTSLFGLPGVQSVFFIYGVVFFLLVLMGSFVMVNPPEGYQPAGWTPPDADNGHEGGVEFRARDMLRTPQFYMLWVIFIFSGLAGLMTIGIIKLFGIDALTGNGIDPTKANVITGTAMGLFYALLNGLGRIVWDWLWITP